MNRRTFVAATVAGFGACLPLLNGCAPAETSTPAYAARSADAPKGRMLVIILDETASFCDQWDQAVKTASAGVRELYPGDSCVVIGLDDHSWNSDDVRVAMTTLPLSTLPAAQAKANLAESIRKLRQRPTSSGFTVNGKPRGAPPGTDTAGALDYAAYLARDAGNRAVTVAMFTDLENEPPKVETARRDPNPLPRFTHLFVYQIRSRGGNDTTKRIGEWIARANAMRTPGTPDICAEQDFHLIGAASQTPSFFGWTH
ncbi:MAG TPA: hypothetical protein VKT77_04240 [Chthonomonadaceae bacterium]|nr:hypothetical protein [Chthonomonadaceae bacterium]